jgi:hypothetical protein
MSSARQATRPKQAYFSIGGTLPKSCGMVVNGVPPFYCSFAGTTANKRADSKYPPRKLQGVGYTGPVTISNY